LAAEHGFLHATRREARKRKKYGDKAALEYVKWQVADDSAQTKQRDFGSVEFKYLLGATITLMTRNIAMILQRRTLLCFATSEKIQKQERIGS
jgi:hypothetical protein